MGIKTHRSFTLIELIVAVGVIGIVLPAVYGIFFSIIRQQLVLIAYQEMKQQGDSAEINIKNILQNRTLIISNSDYSLTTSDMCPLLTSPTPTYSPDMYIMDKDQRKIHLSLNGTQIASIAADVDKTYNLTSLAVTVPNSDVGFTCYRVNQFMPAIVATKFIVIKSTVFKDTNLPYSFNSRLGSY